MIYCNLFIHMQNIRQPAMIHAGRNTPRKPPYMYRILHRKTSPCPVRIILPTRRPSLPDDMPMSAFVRADPLDKAIGFEPGNLLFNGLRSYAYPRGKSNRSQ